MGHRGSSRRLAAVAIRSDGRRVPAPLPESTTLLERVAEFVGRIRDHLGTTTTR